MEKTSKFSDNRNSFQKILLKIHLKINCHYLHIYKKKIPSPILTKQMSLSHFQVDHLIELCECCFSDGQRLCQFAFTNTQTDELYCSEFRNFYSRHISYENIHRSSQISLFFISLRWTCFLTASMLFFFQFDSFGDDKNFSMLENKLISWQVDFVVAFC